MPGALDDLRVLDATGPIGHYAGRLLADLGADVIKVEPTAGDPARRWAPLLPGAPDGEGGLNYILLNANKRGLTLDLADAEGRTAFLALLATADVLLQSWSPAEVAHLGLADEELRRVRPDLVNCSITGWGLTGPYASWAYADIVADAMSGVMNLAGYPDGPPEQLPDHQGYHCASITAAAGVMAAILHRDATGEGQCVESSMHESLLMAEETAMQAADINGVNRERTGGSSGALGFRLPGLGVYDTADGHIYSMCTGNAGSGFPGLVELMRSLGDAGPLEDEPYASFIQTSFNTARILAMMQDPAEAAKAAGILKAIEEHTTRFFARWPTQRLYEEGQALRVLLGAVNTPHDISTSPQLLARNWFQEIEDPGRGRRFRYPGPPWLLHGTPAVLYRPAPLLGEHTTEVLAEAGLQAGEIGALARAGVIR